MYLAAWNREKNTVDEVHLALVRMENSGLIISIGIH